MSPSWSLVANDWIYNDGPTNGKSVIEVVCIFKNVEPIEYTDICNLEEKSINMWWVFSFLQTT